MVCVIFSPHEAYSCNNDANCYAHATNLFRDFKTMMYNGNKIF